MTTILTTRFSTKLFVRVLAAAMAVSGAGLATAQVPLMTTEYVAIARQDLQQVVAPVALYPDAMLAQALVASTYPQDVVSAAQWLREGGNPLWVDFQNWDASVKGLAHYPEALYLLADNYDWMNQLGAAFMNQRDEVMASVQDVRNRAFLNGCLVSNSYQNVVVERQTVQIIPANPQMIYVPVYQPRMILMDRPVFVEPANVISFGLGVQVGAWLHLDCDWNDNAVYVGNWGSNRPWWHDRDFRRDGGNGGYVHNRPGYFVSDRNVAHGGNIDNPARWQRDARRPAPRPEVHTSIRQLPMPQRSVATVATMPAPLAPSVRERLTAVSHENPAARPAIQTPAARPTHPATAAPSNARPVANPVSHRESAPAVRPTPVAPVPAVRNAPAVRPTAAVRPTPAPSVASARPTPAPVVRPAPAPSVPAVRPAATPVVRPTPAPSAPAARPTPAPVVRPAPAPSVPAARPTPAPTVRPTPAPSAPVARPTPAPTHNPSTPPAARPASPTGRPGADANTRDGATNSPRGR